MADKLLPLGLAAVPYATNNYHKVYHPAREQYEKMRGNGPQAYTDDDINSVNIMEEKGMVLRKRSEVQSDEEIVEVVRHRGQRLPRRPGLPRQSSSMNDLRDQRVVPYRGGRGRDREQSDSEGSVPPKSRNGRNRAKSTSGSKNRSSSASSSDLGSSTEDEKKCRSLARKKWVTAGLASVATIHAASKVYSSIENHDKRIQEVQAGTISPEEAHKKQRQARWQDAAAIAIAALGIKGAISEWNDAMAEQKEHKELQSHSEEMHKKRLEHERRKKARDQGGYYKGRDGNWYYDGPQPQGFGSNAGHGPSRGPPQDTGPRKDPRRKERRRHEDDSD